MANPSALIAKHSIRIQASPDAVWEALTRTVHIKEWDDIPEGFAADALSDGSVLEWDGYAVLTVTGYEAPRTLRIAYHSPRWPQPVDGIEYGYAIRPTESGCELTLRVGDWALAPDGNGKDYFNASVDFVAEAAARIKDIAERR